MRKYFFAGLLFVAFFSMSNLFAQQPNQETASVTLKPTFVIADVLFVDNALNSIDIKGGEVDAFLECKETLKTFKESLKGTNKKLGETMTVEIKASIAQNIINFLQRAEFKGANAQNYKRFYEALVEAAKAAGNK